MNQSEFGFVLKVVRILFLRISWLCEILYKEVGNSSSGVSLDTMALE